ncbi:MAG TPA: tetratricopeptide repeat protein [Nostocaceae cyanobacterium]|nr:tetratricopeptide repeat protein [Nostocaceae cyanobacterium]
MDLATGKVIVLEANAGQSRREYLQQILNQDASANTWLVRCDRHEAGPWSGLNELLINLLSQVQSIAPDLITKHDYELTRVMPEWQKIIAVRYPCLTDISPQQEQIRNYPADRAFRIIHGVINFLLEWFEKSQSSRWVIACDRFDCSGGLVRIFFGELMRRCRQKIDLTLIVAISPECNQSDVLGKFKREYLGEHLCLNLTADETDISQSEIADLAAKLQRQLEDDLIEQETHLPKLINYLRLSNQPAVALKYQIKAAHLYTRRGFYEDALEHAQLAFAELERNYPEDIDRLWSVSAILYSCYLALDKPTLALETITNAMQKTDNHQFLSQGYFMLAMLYIRALPGRDLSQAEKYLDQGLVELEQTDLSAEFKLFQTTFNRNGMALVRHRQGQPQAAIEICEWCYQQVNAVIQPDQHLLYRSVLLFNIAQVYDFTGNFSQALEYLTDAIAIDPNYSEYHNLRGNIHFKLGNLADALTDYQRAIELSAPYPEVWANIGQCHRYTGNLPAAIEAYSIALDLQNNQFSILVARAQVLEMVGQLEAALSDYNQALSLDANQPLVLANRAILLYELGEIAAAVADLNQAIALEPENADLYQNRAIACIANGDIDTAVRDLQTYLNLRPDADDRQDVENQLVSYLEILQKQ